MTAIVKIISIFLTTTLAIGLILYTLYWLPMWIFACPVEDIVFSLPVGSKERFTVLVARLEKDREEEQSVFIRQVFRTFTGIESIDTCKRMRVFDTSEHQEYTKQQGQQWLRNHQAELLVYGQDQQDSIRLLFINRNTQQNWQRLTYLSHDTLEVPRPFLEDFRDHVRAFALTHALFSTQPQQSSLLLDTLQPLVSGLEESLHTPIGVRYKGDRAFIVGTILALIGENRVGIEWLERARDAYHLALQTYNQARMIRSWSLTQNNVGIVYHLLGERTGERVVFEQALKAYRVASNEYSVKQDIPRWLVTQMNLALTLTSLAENNADITLLQEAISIYRAVLSHLNRNVTPLKWAHTQHYLSNALRIRGELDEERGDRWLQEAIVAARLALEERSRQDTPLEWAETQNILGNALIRRADRDQADISLLQEAVIAYRAAILVYETSRFPLAWAGSQSNLGLALTVLGERRQNMQDLEEAVLAYQAALQQYSRTLVPVNWAIIQINQAGVLRRLGVYNNDRQRLQQAYTVIQEAIDVLRSLGSSSWIDEAEKERREISHALNALQ